MFPFLFEMAIITWIVYDLFGFKEEEITDTDNKLGKMGVWQKGTG